ncbi:Immunoglobulin I-set domain [Popillia japonica]|uniref:Immunoglobulin I-set domain n=1 Tax=Popillia japonica TaxID=7064 RepID=A0AAW1IX17_POPJA
MYIKPITTELPITLSKLSFGINVDDVYLTRIKWYKNHTLIADNGPPVILPPDRFKLWGNGSLEVVRVQPPDTGEYMCEVIRNEPWGPIKQSHAIEVLHPPSIESDPAKSDPASGYLEVKLGEEVRISCIGKGVPNPVITWKRNGKDLKLINNRHFLSFSAADRYLAGKYECIATNGVGEPATKEIQLKITYPPELTTMKSWIHTAPGFRAQLDCKVTSDPSSQVIWYKGNNPINSDNHRVLLFGDDEKYSLIIRNVQRSDFGIYTCKAVNEIGEETLEFQLSGVPNPAEFKKSEEKNVNSETSYTLIWEVDSFTPIIEYTLWFRPHKAQLNHHRSDWTKLTIPTEHKTNSGYTYSKLYTIRGLKEKTAYEVLLLSRNRYGWSKASPILKFSTAGADETEDIVTSVETETENILENIGSIRSNVEVQPTKRQKQLGSRRAVGNMAAFRYTHAIVCRIPLSLRTRGEIELEEAKKQHEAYVRLLRELGLDVIELPPDETLPECVFVEDTAVICNGTALITRPGAAHRSKEVETIRVVLKKELDLPIIEISDPNARIDGGDVLFTGQEFFVGISEWTNEAGARALAAAFPEYPCTPIKVPESKHLKSFVTMGGPNLLCIGAGKEAQEVLKRMEREATFSYQTLTLPEDQAANVLYLNGTLVHRTIEEIPNSFKVFSEKIDYPRRCINISQLAKAASGLTSSCILVKRTKHIRNL